VRNIVVGFYARKFLAIGKTLEIAGQSGILTAITGYPHYSEERGTRNYCWKLHLFGPDR
jgi:hypothetical protein